MAARPQHCPHLPTDSRAMGQWETKYTREQRAAIERAYLDRGPLPATDVARRARAGELTYDGEKVDAFDIPDSMVRDIGRKAERRRIGVGPSKLVVMPHMDAVEVLRKRSVSVCDLELDRLERLSQHGKKPVDLDQMRRVVRLLRELAAMPSGPKDAPKVGPGTQGEKSHQDMGADVLKAMRGSSPATDTPTLTPGSTGQATPATTTSNAANGQHHGQDDELLGTAPIERFAPIPVRSL